MTELTVPLADAALPQDLLRFAGSSAPLPARKMAARGMLPLKGASLVGVLVQLSADADAEVAEAAHASLKGLPEGVLLGAVDGALHAAFLHKLAALFESSARVLEKIATNPNVHPATVQFIAGHASESIAERIGVNEALLLKHPEIIEALYKNPNTRMSTIDRLVELAYRNGVKVDGIPAFEAHATSLKGQLIAEPSDEPLPSDTAFLHATHSDDDAEVADQDDDGQEKLKEKYIPLSMQIGNMGLGEKLRLAMIGNASARALLVRDNNKQVALAAIASPRTTDKEAASIATSREVAEEVLRYIGNRRQWVGAYDVKRALVFNPKTPLATALKFLSHLRTPDLKTLSRGRGVSGAIRTAATQLAGRRRD